MANSTNAASAMRILNAALVQGRLSHIRVEQILNRDECTTKYKFTLDFTISNEEAMNVWAGFSGAVPGPPPDLPWATSPSPTGGTRALAQGPGAAPAPALKGGDAPQGTHLCICGNCHKEVDTLVQVEAGEIVRLLCVDCIAQAPGVA